MSLTKVSYSMVNGAPANVLDFGGVMNTSDASTRTTNKAALIAAMSAQKEVCIPQGMFWTDGDIELPSGVRLVGFGKQATTIKADGDLFKVSAAVTSEIRIESMQLQNDVTRGKLIKIIVGSATSGVSCKDVYFNTAQTHFFSNSLLVDQYFYDCTFLDATSFSREYTAGIWASQEFNTYTWNCGGGVYAHGGDSYTVGFHGCVFEQLNYQAIYLNAAAGDIEAWTFNACHFEQNSKTSPTTVPHVTLQGGVGHRLRAVQFNGCSWFTVPAIALTEFVTLAAGGGVIAEVTFNGGQFFGDAYPATNNQYVTFNQVCFNNAPTYASRGVQQLPVTVNSGATAVIGATGSVNPLSTPSSDWNMDFTQNTVVNIANNGTYDLGAGSGLLILGESAGQVMGLLFLAVATVTVVTNATGNITNAVGTASKLNVYYNAGTSSYRVQNLTGAAVNLYFGMQRVRASN